MSNTRTFKDTKGNDVEITDKNCHINVTFPDGEMSDGTWGEFPELNKLFFKKYVVTEMETIKNDPTEDEDFHLYGYDITVRVATAGERRAA